MSPRSPSSKTGVRNSLILMGEMVGNGGESEGHFSGSVFCRFSSYISRSQIVGQSFWGEIEKVAHDAPSTNIFLVAAGRVAVMPSSSRVSFTWQPSRDLKHQIVQYISRRSGLGEESGDGGGRANRGTHVSVNPNAISSISFSSSSGGGSIS
jgi:hypothetical protein